MTAVQLVDLLDVLRTELSLEHGSDFIRVVGLDQHGWFAVASTKRSVFVVHDGCQIVREPLGVGLVERVLVKSVFKTLKDF